jgi:hypothetical protein
MERLPPKTASFPRNTVQQRRANFVHCCGVFKKPEQSVNIVLLLTAADKWSKADLRAVCLAGYTKFTADLEHGDIPHREIQVRHVLELGRLARDLGGNLVQIITGYEDPTRPLRHAME